MLRDQPHAGYRQRRTRQPGLNGSTLRARRSLAPLPVTIKVPGPTTLARNHACLRAALNAAVKSRRIPFNPTNGVTLPSAPKKQIHPWEAAELGRFLDYTSSHRLGSLFAVLAFAGLRRGEALGLKWTDVDVGAGTITICRQLLNQWDENGAVFGVPKTESGVRVIELDSGTLGTLITHRLRQDEERANWGAAYRDYDLVFCREDGSPYDPNKISKVFKELAIKAGLRPVRLHDLRHGCASLMLAAGVPIEVVSKHHGHSGIDVTVNIYGHLLAGVGRRAAENAMGLVPRAPKPADEPPSDHNEATTGSENDKAASPETGKAAVTSGDAGAPGGIRTPNLLIRRSHSTLHPGSSWVHWRLAWWQVVQGSSAWCGPGCPTWLPDWLPNSGIAPSSSRTSTSGERFGMVRNRRCVLTASELISMQAFLSTFRTFLSPGGVRELPPGCGGCPVRGVECAAFGRLGVLSSGIRLGGCWRVSSGRACSRRRRFLIGSTRCLACLPHAGRLRFPSLPRR